MRDLDLPTRKGPNEKIEDFLARVIASINEASRDRPELTASTALTITNFAPGTDDVVTFDPTSVTLPNLAKAFATFLTFLHTQGPKGR